ncbi:5-hydroxytryptamine receptor 1D-like [Paramacrobiotus metropolitanus]|uniref:5-hydroxytryptamine receptor 1D-like n=1 Tax=Paramacrobiotus metropolitanus TaxID=2943436 RepID=UPI002445FD87|nr:5-hydroxytryptamine receptor 1D-like [Paramacrobiotus metropolitanus]
MDNVSANYTTIPIATWQPAAMALTVIFILGLVCNAAVTTVFVFNKDLWSSFNVYLCNLLVANLIYFFLGAPFDIIEEVFPHWWLGQSVCTLYLYAYWTITPVQILTHCSIAVNRIWALYRPISYRTRHTIATAIKICVFLWLFAHLIGLPGVLVDAVHFQQKNMCVVDTTDSGFLQIWQLLINVIGFLCIFTILAAFPLVLGKMQKPRRVSISMRGKLQHSVSQTFADHSQRQTVLLLVLTVSVFVLWSPLMLYEALRSFLAMDFPTVEAVFMVMFNAQSLLDPILLVLTLKSVRGAALAMFYPRKWLPYFFN